MPQEHPFFDATLNDEILINGERVYTDCRGRFAYTYPVYDPEEKAFKYMDYDMLFDTESEVTEPLIDVVENSMFWNEMEWLEDLCIIFGITREEINKRIEEINKWGEQ